MTTLRCFIKKTEGATAVEFALVSGLFITTVLFIIFIALLQYLNQSLDYATAKAARQIMTGYVQKNSISQSSFRTGVVCPYLPAAFSCGNVIIRVQSVPEAAKPSGYYSFVDSGATGLVQPTLAVDSNAYSIGVQKSYTYLQVVYPITFLPSFLLTILGQKTTYNGLPAFLLTSTAAFKNEQY